MYAEQAQASERIAEIIQEAAVKVHSSCSSNSPARRSPCSGRAVSIVTVPPRSGWHRCAKAAIPGWSALLALRRLMLDDVPDREHSL